MDIWEANSVANGLTPHTCTREGFYKCSGSECDLGGICDKWGCGFNPYALGKHNYYGPYDRVNTAKPFTVTTQFITNDGTTSGTLIEIRRLYKQGGRVIQNAVVNYNGGTIDSLQNAYCNATAPYFTQNGGLAEST